jgi:hypothetical protein
MPAGVSPINVLAVTPSGGWCNGGHAAYLKTQQQKPCTAAWLFLAPAG